MSPMRHQSTTVVLGAPENWDQSEAPCEGLPITQAIEDGLPVLHSWWEPTDEERLRLLAGAPVRLTVIGRGHPPVRLEVDL